MAERPAGARGSGAETRTADGAVRWRLATAVMERHRVLRGMTRDALARAAQVDPKTVRDALNGRRRPTLGTVTQLVRVLELTLGDVLVFDQPTPSPHGTVHTHRPTSVLAPEQLRLV